MAKKKVSDRLGGIKEQIKRDTNMIKVQSEKEAKMIKMKKKKDQAEVKKILEASYQNQNEASKSLSDMGYKYDPELSTNESKVFVDPWGNPNIAFRGSKRVSDFLLSDAALAVGLETYDRRFQEAKHLTKLVEDKYHRPADVFGHSLGGSLGEKSGSKGDTYTYNKGAGIFDIGRTIPENQTDYRTTSDPISIISTSQKHKGLFEQIESPKFQNPLDAHGLNNL